METAGFDLVVEFSKTLLNKVLAAGFSEKFFNSQNIPQLKGSWNLPDIPPEFLQFGKVDYELAMLGNWAIFSPILLIS